MRVIDCFPFFDEFIALDIRFYELYDVVDKFVIVESPETFTGIEKPLYLSECLYERYSEYADKVEIIIPPKFSPSLEEMIDGPYARIENYAHKLPWQREYFQKNHISKSGLEFLELNNEDLILYADADEIPKREAILFMRENGFDPKGGAFGGPTFYYKLNMLTSEPSFRPGWISYGEFTNHTYDRYDNTHKPIIPDSGWHFSYIKSPEDIQRKLAAFSHGEFNNPSINNIDHIINSINEGKDILNRPDMNLKVVDIDETFPHYVRENQELLKEWIA